MTGFMLDTDISSYIIKRRPEAVLKKFKDHSELLSVSVMTAAELRFGAEKSKAGNPKLSGLVEAYLERLAIIDWTDDVTSHYASIRTELERAGRSIGSMDLLIASHAVSQDMILVTNNLKHFSNVQRLKIEVWN